MKRAWRDFDVREKAPAIAVIIVLWLGANLAFAFLVNVPRANAAAELEGLTCTLTVLPSEEQAAAKRAYVDRLGAGRCAVIGNGRNDHLMLAAAALGVAVMEAEGAAPVTLAVADVATRDAIEALDLFLHPLRLVATLRG